MARSSKLKVFRTAIGFHDAYVAAPSQKAALEAWGANNNLFARGVAEIVTDATLTAAALAAPGEVIKVSRGTPAEQLAALDKAALPGRVRTTADAGLKAKSAGKSPPRPSRRKLDVAEAALDALERQHREQSEVLDREEQALRKRQAALRQVQGSERATIEKKRETARTAYDRALAAWRDA